MIPIGLITAGLGLAGQAASSYFANKQIGDLMKKMQAPSDKPVQLAQSAYGKAQSMEQGQMPGTESYERMIRENQAKQTAAAERAGGDVIANAALASGAANEASQNLAGQKAQFKMGAQQQTQAASQNLQNSIMQNEQLKNDYIQSLISGKASQMQNWANLGKGVTGLGSGIMGNTAYLQGAGKELPKFLGTTWG